MVDNPENNGEDGSQGADTSGGKGTLEGPRRTESAAPRRPCPICQKMSVPKYRPFCSRRCADVDLARSYGLNGVPAMVFNDKYLVSGAQPANVLRQVVERIVQESTAGA